MKKKNKEIRDKKASVRLIQNSGDSDSGKQNMDITQNTKNVRLVNPPQLVTFYKDYLRTQNTAEFVQVAGHTYSQATLLRLTQSQILDCRRAATLALTFLGDYTANTTFGYLLQDDDQTVRLLAENGIKNIWTRAGNEQQRAQLRGIMRLVAIGQFHEAVEKANILIAESPNYAEAWNQRGIAFFGMKMFDEAIDDANTTLELNPFHFGAAVGMGHAYMQIRDLNAALECFDVAVKINPNLLHIRKLIEKIEVEKM